MTDTNSRAVHRRSVLKAAGAGVVATGLAGCRSSESSTTTTVGVLAPEIGNFSPGTSIKRGAELAVQEINEDGGLLGEDVEIAIKDTERTPSTAQTKYKNLILEEAANVTVGVFASEVLTALMEEFSNQERVHLTSGAATPASTQKVRDNYEKYKYYFRTGPLNAAQLGVNLLDFAGNTFSDIGWNEVAILAEDRQWNRPVYGTLTDKLESEAGVSVVSQERYSDDTQNFTPLFDNINSAGADAAFVLMAQTGIPAITQWAQNQRQFGFGGIHVPSQLPSLWGQMMGACQYVVSQNAATPQSEITDKTQPFVQAYQDKYDSLPVYTGYITYDAVKQWASVVSERETIDTEEIIGGLEQSSYTGTIGTIEYHGKGQKHPHDVIYSPQNVNPVYQQWQASDNGGAQEVIYPSEFKTSDYQQPAWIQ